MKKLTWYHKLGFFNNPFSIKPAVFHNELFGHDKTISDINNVMSESNIIFISGEYGTGKTTILKGIISKFKKSFFEGKKIIYYNCNKSEKPIDYDGLLINAGSFLNRIFKIRKSHMIILLDEIQDMNKKDIDQIKRYYDDGFFKSVVLVSKYKDVELTKELEAAIGNNKFELGNMTKKQAVEMIRKRIGSLEFISDDIIIKIFAKDANSRSFLKNCENVCRYAFGEGDILVSEEHVKKILG